MNPCDASTRPDCPWLPCWQDLEAVMRWCCPHHSCAVCHRKTSAAGGLLFRCEVHMLMCCQTLALATYCVRMHNWLRQLPVCVQLQVPQSTRSTYPLQNGSFGLQDHSVCIQNHSICPHNTVFAVSLADVRQCVLRGPPAGGLASDSALRPIPGAGPSAAQAGDLSLPLLW